jgi:bifunctional oligoribonuclease and PAP phosphatase NrnA
MERHYPEHAARFEALLRDLGDRDVAIVGHARPDGDCIGSQIALARVLRALGVDAVCANPDPVPRRLEFLVRDVPFVRFDNLPAGELTAVFVDCADGERAGPRFRTRFPRPFANIDHHLSNAGYAEHNFVDVGSSATCEILAGLFHDLHLPVDPEAAQALYTGIVTDTGQFRFNSTSRRTFLLAAELMARGAQPSIVGAEVYERESRGKLMLLQRFLSSLSFEAGGRVCVGLLPQGVFEETGTNQEDTEGLVDYARSIDGVDIGVLIEERPEGVKASLRSRDPAFRMDRIAGRFQGGGHACAAGLNFKGGRLCEFRVALLGALAEQIAAVDALRRGA